MKEPTIKKNLIVAFALLILGGACGLQDQTDEWSHNDIEILLEEISQDHADQGFAEHSEQAYLACVAAEFMREYAPEGIDSLTRLEADVVRARAYLECQGEIEFDADGTNKADQGLQRK